MAIDLRAELEKERTALAAEKSAMSAEDEQAMADLAELERIREERERLAEGRRKLALEGRMAAARERLGEKVRFESLDLGEDSFLVAHDERAYKAWERGLRTAKGADRDAIERNYASAAIVDWNGRAVTPETASEIVTVGGVKNTLGHLLAEHLKGHQAHVTSIVNAAARLGGLAITDRKSGR